MITCPKCSSTLPDWAQTCQFCQADTKTVVRPVAPVKQRKSSSFDPPKWVWWAYYGISGYWVFDGLLGIIQGVFELAKKGDSPIGFFPYISILFGAISVGFGIGLILRNDTIRGIVNFVCAIRLIRGFFGLFGSALGTLILGPLGLLLMFLSVVTIVTSALMIYLIGETDRFSY